MKNIFLLPTDKPSRLHLGESGLVLCDLVFNNGTINSQHLYITSDEEIKKRNPILETDTNTINIAGNDYIKNESDLKVILTTDPDLIKDGVQAIDDAFLEWFVKNQTCEFVKVEQ